MIYASALDLILAAGCIQLAARALGNVVGAPVLLRRLAMAAAIAAGLYGLWFAEAFQLHRGLQPYGGLEDISWLAWDVLPSVATVLVVVTLGEWVMTRAGGVSAYAAILAAAVVLGLMLDGNFAWREFGPTFCLSSPICEGHSYVGSPLHILPLVGATYFAGVAWGGARPKRTCSANFTSGAIVVTLMATVSLWVGARYLWGESQHPLAVVLSAIGVFVNHAELLFFPLWAMAMLLLGHRIGGAAASDRRLANDMPSYAHLAIGGWA